MEISFHDTTAFFFVKWSSDLLLLYLIEMVLLTDSKKIICSKKFLHYCVNRHKRSSLRSFWTKDSIIM